jgi:hypothetical protein
MKNFLTILKGTFTIFTLLCAFAGCSKDEEESLLTGHWMFKEANIIYYLNEKVYNVKEEEGSTSDDLNRSFRGYYFIFEGKILSAGSVDDCSGLGTYSVSGDIITVKNGDNTTAMIMKYQLSGRTLDLIFTRNMFELWMGALPDILEITSNYYRIETAYPSA